MKRKNWFYVSVIIAFFVSCGQSLYKLHDADESTDSDGSAASSLQFGYDKTCAVEKNDPFEIRIRLDKAEYPCLDSTSRRPLVDLTQDSKWSSKLGKPKNGVKRVANFKHNDKFYIADIPMDAVHSLEFQLSWFAAPADLPAAHAQMLVAFNQEAPIQLYPQDTRASDQRAQEELSPTSILSVHSLILSAEGAGEVGKTCELIGGQQGKFALVYGVGSAHQRYSEVLRFNPKREIDSFPLLVTDRSQMSDYLELYLNTSFENFENLEAQVDPNDFSFIKDLESRNAAIQSSRRAKFEKATYRTIGRNCATALVELIEKSGMSQNSKPLVAALGKVSFYPPAAAFFLHSQKLLKLKNKKKLNLAAELEKHRAEPLSDIERHL